MARAHSFQESPDRVADPQPGEWQALRGELVALLDQVEGRYAHVERVERDEPALDGLSQRVRNLRDQVLGPEPVDRRREALRTVKRAVDRFSFRDEAEQIEAEQDSLASAIAEIRGRQISGTAAALGHRVIDMPEFRELSGLVGGLSGRLETLEGELKSQRTSNGSVHEVASQVEQLTHVVELLAGAVGETGQVKRLESQIAALAALIEKGPKVGLNAINKRLDDLSTTVGKLAELQAQQMEREIGREDRLTAAPASADAGKLAPAMAAIEAGVRNVYDRIDSIEKNVTLSSGDFERLTAEMAAFTKAMKDRETAPGALVSKVDALASRIGDFHAANGDVAGLKQDVMALRQAVMAGMAPRFDRIESQLEALSDRMGPAADTAQVESQLKLLIKRMDETGAQLNGLTKLYAAPQDAASIEAVAILVAERTSEAVTRKAPAPVAMFGPDSLKSIEDRLATLIKSAGKTPDYEALADLVAEKTSQAVAKSAVPAAPGMGQDGMQALEKRIAALFNTAGQDTAERLLRLEAALNQRADARPATSSARAEPPASRPAPMTERSTPDDDTPEGNNGERLEAMLAALGSPLAESDAMPTNPGDDAPLIDPGFRDTTPVRSALAAKFSTTPPSVTAAPPAASKPAAAGKPVADKAAAPAPAGRPAFDPASVERPPRPQSSLAQAPAEPFSVTPPPVSHAEAQLSQNSTSTFVAAARRAQRARTEAAVPDATGNSIIGRALSRFMPDKTPAAGADPLPPVDKPAKTKPAKTKPAEAPKVEAVAAPSFAGPDDEAEQEPSFLTRHRRPLLLAATLVAVSMLALNLVMQRMAEQPQQAAVAAPTPVAPPAQEPAAADEVSLVRPEPRVIDMIDDTATGSINPNVSSFTRSALPTTPMPPTLLANSGTTGRAATPAATPATEQLVTGSIASQPESTATFALPVEDIGPLELRRAAANGDAKAQFEVAAIFGEGRAVEQDYAEAAIWYERSAAQGFVPAQYRLGNLYETGTGVDKDLAIAKLWYQRAAEASNRMAMHNLAALYAGGQLGEQAFETAAEWFEQAASRGMTDSQFNLGMLYARGLGVPQDFEQSYKWFALAAMGGDADAAKASEDIAKSLSADAVSRINAEVAVWKMTPIDLAANFAPIGTWSDKFVTGEAITSREVIAKVQLALGKLGFDIGTPDGVVGPKTAEAIRTFERGTGMSETGIINPRLLAVLGSQPV
ncbi:peptidoglycan-binding protein [Devosia beringensis]|uniref:peptidoglycan-binding protein n=1 Tax=Devosia beringensis TaxID=2657486 RepID=UPI00186BAD43|nr:peptidoglycan-binding protein [Devosia beringensis]